MDDSILSLEVENLRELLRLKSLNDRLLDANQNLLSRLVKSGLPLDPETESLILEVRKTLRLIALPTEPKRPDEGSHRDDFGRPNGESPEPGQESIK
jgi:hypothetical protein